MRTLALAIVVAAMACSSFAQNVVAQQSVRRIIQNEILSLVPADGAGGIAIAVCIDGQLIFFDEGFADLSERRPITSDSLFNVASLRKPFEATLLALAVREGKMALGDPVSTYLPALSEGGDIRRGRSARDPHIGASAAARPSAVADDPLHAGKLRRSPQGVEGRCGTPARPATYLHPRRLHPAAARARAGS